MSVDLNRELEILRGLNLSPGAVLQELARILDGGATKPVASFLYDYQASVVQAVEDASLERESAAKEKLANLVEAAENTLREFSETAALLSPPAGDISELEAQVNQNLDKGSQVNIAVRRPVEVKEGKRKVTRTPSFDPSAVDFDRALEPFDREALSCAFRWLVQEDQFRKDVAPLTPPDLFTLLREGDLKALIVIAMTSDDDWFWEEALEGVAEAFEKGGGK